ncbi:hypothetical protein [Novosphingobium subterraneum]|uniref:Uncharacterized protein n=1 Tax=Novosphingobium subterraneum TaxID=48936 RepID=A0A0B9A5Q3_9SPHN|nr:hypothetical protein [Novosphingobium subterraneum]KHS45926.1 hypothetical protein NJ75_02533 [Novosphingobium subterraneum]
MIELQTIAEAIPLPATPEGWFDYGYTALADGRLALIRTRKDVHSEHMRWWEAAKGGWRSPKYPKVWDDDMRLSIFDGSTESNVAVMPSGAHPIVDRMPDGRWLVAGSRADRGEKNGVIYSADGRKESEMILGDGIETLLGASDATIWVGYFDEGVFGGENKDGSWPVSSGGLVQFDATGRVFWSFNEQHRDEGGMDDIYAMTLVGDKIWACYYSGFPIVRISGGKPVFWSNSVAGAKAIAVKDDIVMLGGGYSDDANRITLVKLDGKSSHELGSLRYGKGTRGAASLRQGRGSVIHIVSDGVWSKVPVYKAAAAISRDRRP